MNFIKFIFSKSFLINSGVAFTLLVGGYFVLDHYLAGYTKTGEEIPVPDVTNEHIDDLTDLLEKEGFRYELVDSIWNRKINQGFVTEQRPKSGQLVKPGRKIYITFNARSTKKIKLHLDNVKGGGVRAALDNLQSMDVVVDSIEYEDYQFNDVVLGIKNRKGKNLSNDALVNAGAKLILVVGKTGESTTKVPKVTGKTLEEAKKELIANSLNVSEFGMKYHNCGDQVDSTKAHVVRQSPKAFEEVNSGSSVSIFYDCNTVKK